MYPFPVFTCEKFALSSIRFRLKVSTKLHRIRINEHPIRPCKKLCLAFFNGVV